MNEHIVETTAETDASYCPNTDDHRHVWEKGDGAAGIPTMRCSACGAERLEV